VGVVIGAGVVAQGGDVRGGEWGDGGPDGDLGAVYIRAFGYLAKALANWKSAAQRELERRGQWHPEKLPPQSMLRHAQVW
jgi:hypothetical protein